MQNTRLLTIIAACAMLGPAIGAVAFASAPPTAHHPTALSSRLNAAARAPRAPQSFLQKHAWWYAPFNSGHHGAANPPHYYPFSSTNGGPNGVLGPPPLFTGPGPAFAGPPPMVSVGLNFP